MAGHVHAHTSSGARRGAHLTEPTVVRVGLTVVALVFLGVFLVLPLAMAGAVRADEVTDWHEHMLVALTKGGGNSQIRSRNAAHVSAAVFDAVNGIERRYTPIHVPAAAPPGASKRAARDPRSKQAR